MGSDSVLGGLRHSVRPHPAPFLIARSTLIDPAEHQVDKLTERMKDYWQSWGAQNGASGTAMIREIRTALGK